jgi:hypothetical protein
MGIQPPERAKLELHRAPSSLKRARWYLAKADEGIARGRLSRGHWVVVATGRQLQIVWGDAYQSVTLDFQLAEIPSIGKGIDGMARSYSDDGMRVTLAAVTMIRVRCDDELVNAPG